jgi:purine-nucleoside phosphorylase
MAAAPSSGSDKYDVAGIVAFLRTKVPYVPEVAIVCGSGLSTLADTITNQIVVDYSEIKNFPTATVGGHGKSLVFGDLGGKKVVAMSGRFHFYEV